MKNTSKTEKDVAASYNAFKQFEGRRYTGMKVGRSHSWIYDSGPWKETKITPDEWQIQYAVTKRRKGKAPEGSGVPVGTAYHWYVLAHQFVQKLNANDYSTELTGVKYKLAHRRADTGRWSASDGAQRRSLIKFLEEMIADLEKEPVKIEAEERKAAKRTKAAAAQRNAARRGRPAARTSHWRKKKSA